MSEETIVVIVCLVMLGIVYIADAIKRIFMTKYQIRYQIAKLNKKGEI